MKLFGIEITRSKTPKHYTRNYASAKSDRLTADWLTGNQTADQLIRWSLTQLRNRSRELERNNSYAKNFFRKLKINVIGPNGINFQNKAKDSAGKQKKGINSHIETQFELWTEKENISVCGTLSFRDIQNLAIESAARDGEVLIHKIKGYDNKFGFALQVIEADHLDEKLNIELPNRNTIRMGIEFNKWGRPVSYHLFTKHPGDYSYAGQRYQIIPAEEIIHIFLKERPTQSRGVPWMHTAMIHLRMLGAYEEAAVVNARIGASKMQSIIMGDGAEFTGDSKDIYDNIQQDVEPGMREVLPPGTTLHDTNPAYPSGEFAPFNKAMLRGISSGFGTSYNSLANDLEGVNFSSLRSGALEERDCYKWLQRWFIEHFCDEIIYDWANMAMLSGNLKIPADEVDNLIVPRWQPRTWDWVDPEKDINSKIIALESGLITRQQIAAEMGIDFDDLIEQLTAEKELLASKGLDFKKEKPVDTKPKTEMMPQDEIMQQENMQKKLSILNFKK